MGDFQVLPKWYFNIISNFWGLLNTTVLWFSDVLKGAELKHFGVTSSHLALLIHGVYENHVFANLIGLLQLFHLFFLFFFFFFI